MNTVVGVPVTTVWTAPDAVRDIDSPIVAADPDPRQWNRNLASDPPSALHGRVDSQALLGEPIEVHSEHRGWCEVTFPWQPSSEDPRGYPGWIPAAHIDTMAVHDGAYAVVAAPTTRLGATELSYGTVLPREPDADVRVRLPDGSTQRCSADVVALPKPSETPDIDSLLASARQFTGMRYLWGGTSGWGLDCSGFVHLVHRRFGRTVPRDARDQITVSDPTPLSNAERGDLYYFGDSVERITHVGFATNLRAAEPQMLHAPDGDGAERIEDASMSEHRRAKLVAAGSLIRAAESPR